jgi:transcriptional regulator with XRE-family HTH domain
MSIYIINKIRYDKQMETKNIFDIIQQLRLERKRKDLSQVDLAQRLGVPQSQINRIEHGGSDIRLSTLLEMAHALGFEPVLIPKTLLPAVRHLLARGQGGEESATGSPRRLLGSDPEETSAEVG